MYPDDMDKPKRKPRVSKKPALVHLTMRVPKEVDDWFRSKGPHHTREIRKVLIEYVAGRIS